MATSTISLPVKNAQGQETGAVEIRPEWLEFEKGAQAVHLAVVAHRAACRSGTACTKTRSEVRGGGAKPWRQKGTGRARAGSTRSPLWRGGGTIFGPKPRDYSKKVNKKVRRLAVKRAFSERLKAGDVLVVEDIAPSRPKTREVKALLSGVGAGEHVLVVVNSPSENLKLGARNLPNVQVLPAAAVDTYRLLRYRKILFDKAGLEAFLARIRPQEGE